MGQSYGQLNSPAVAKFEVIVPTGARFRTEPTLAALARNRRGQPHFIHFGGEILVHEITNDWVLCGNGLWLPICINLLEQVPEKFLSLEDHPDECEEIPQIYRVVVSTGARFRSEPKLTALVVPNGDFDHAIEFGQEIEAVKRENDWILCDNGYWLPVCIQVLRELEYEVPEISEEDSEEQRRIEELETVVNELRNAIDTTTTQNEAVIAGETFEEKDEETQKNEIEPAGAQKSENEGDLTDPDLPELEHKDDAPVEKRSKQKSESKKSTQKIEPKLLKKTGPTSTTSPKKRREHSREKLKKKQKREKPRKVEPKAKNVHTKRSGKSDGVIKEMLKIDNRVSVLERKYNNAVDTINKVHGLQQKRSRANRSKTRSASKATNTRSSPPDISNFPSIKSNPELSKLFEKFQAMEKSLETMSKSIARLDSLERKFNSLSGTLKTVQSLVGTLEKEKRVGPSPSRRNKKLRRRSLPVAHESKFLDPSDISVTLLEGKSHHYVMLGSASDVPSPNSKRLKEYCTYCRVTNPYATSYGNCFCVSEGCETHSKTSGGFCRFHITQFHKNEAKKISLNKLKISEKETLSSLVDPKYWNYFAGTLGEHPDSYQNASELFSDNEVELP